MSRQGRGNQPLVWWVFGLLFVVCAAWALGLPRGTAPDETHQMVRSAAVVRGELAGRPTDVPFAEVTVPRGYVDIDTVCFIGEPHVPLPFPPQQLTDGCWSMTDDTDPVETATPQHRGQPTYYALAGIPTLLASPTLAMHLMRLVAAAACCLLLAWGVTALLQLPDPGLALVAAAGALTPTVLYFASMVNPAGLELAASFGLAACGLALVHTAANPDRWLVHEMGTSLVVLTVTRGLSGLFAVLILAALGVLAGRARARELVRRRAVQLWLAAGVAGAAASLAWTAFVRSRFVEPHWGGSGLGRALGDVGWWSREMVAVFGTTDVVPPLGLHLGWLAAVLWLGWRAWQRRAVLTLSIAGVLVGIAYLALIIPGQAYGVPQTGYWWQGRYVLPLVMVAVLVLGFGPRAGSRSASRSGARAAADDAPAAQRPARMSPTLLGWALLLMVGHLWAFGYAVRHYTVGYDGPVSPLEFGFDPIWSPPLVPPAAYLVVMATALAGLTWLLARAVRRAAATPTAAEASDAAGSSGAPVGMTPQPEPAM